MVTQPGDLAIPTATDGKVGIPEKWRTEKEVPEVPALTWQLCINRNLTPDEIRELQQNGGDLVPILRRVLKMQYCKEVWN
jgi:hypothetical protein